MSYRAYKYRLYPTDDQAAWLNQCFAAVRAVYNAALEQRRTYGRAQGTDAFDRNTSFSQPRQSKELNFRSRPGRPGLADDPDLAWLTEAPRDCFDAALRDLDKAFNNFFDGRAGFPSFRNRDRNNSLSFKAWSRKIDPGTKKSVARPVIVFGQNCVTVPKIGRIRYKRHRKFYGDPKTVEVVREGDEFYIVLVTEHCFPERKHLGPAVGVDLGVSLPVALSTGETIFPDIGLERLEDRARRAAKVLSRRKKGSRRREKQKRHLAKIRRRQARRRAAAAHRATTELTQRFSLIAVEDLAVKNMTGSARGTVEEPGRNVRAKAGLNRAILNVAPHQFRQQLEYKAKKSGSEIIAVDPKHTSQTCSMCGTIDSESRTSQSLFSCTACGHTINADINAARNILMRASPSAGVLARRKPPSEFHQESAAVKANGSCFQPASVHVFAANSTGKDHIRSSESRKCGLT